VRELPGRAVVSGSSGLSASGPTTSLGVLAQLTDLGKLELAMDV